MFRREWTITPDLKRFATDIAKTLKTTKKNVLRRLVEAELADAEAARALRIQACAADALAPAIEPMGPAAACCEDLLRGYLDELYD